jgi:hypothetical protein
MFNEFRRYGIPYVFFTSVYSVCCTKLAKIPRNYMKFSVAEFCIVPRNSTNIGYATLNFFKKT